MKKLNVLNQSNQSCMSLQKVAKSLKKAIPCKRIGVAVIGLEVPHTHVHLVPLQTMNDINFTRAKLKPSQEELAATGDKIRKEMSF